MKKKKNPKKKKKKIQRKPEWLKRVPIDISKLSLDELRNFKEVDKFLTGPIKGPKGWQYFLRCFKFLTAFSIGIILENSYPPLTKCWNDLDKLFMKDKIFSDGLFIQAWMFINFECGKNGETAINLFEDFMTKSETEHDYDYFFNQMKKTRYGIYEEIMSSKRTMKFRELVTGEIVTTIRSIEEFDPGELFLTRIVEYRDELLLFGDPKCWPSESKPIVEGFIDRKMSLFDGNTDSKKYKNLMTKAGPYWMSCVTTNFDLPILDPLYYLKYYED